MTTREARRREAVIAAARELRDAWPVFDYAARVNRKDLVGAWRKLDVLLSRFDGEPTDWPEWQLGPDPAPELNPAHTEESGGA